MHKIITTSLQGKIALVTGGTSGIGLASAQQLAAQGARVFITGRRQDALDEAVALIGRVATGIRADASVLAELDVVYAEIARSAGNLDILFANAGGGDMLPLVAITEEHFDRIFATKRARRSLYGTESAAAAGGWRIGNLNLLNDLSAGHRRVQRLQR